MITANTLDELARHTSSDPSALRATVQRFNAFARRGVDEDVQIAGDTWQSWTDDGGDLAVVREDTEVTTLVVGRVEQETLEELIATLR